ncbi:MAG: TonB-dependent receptor [Methylophilaceae bacterium]|nr:TonB-dependent receptor [Methylophilaceae bacterium]
MNIPVLSTTRSRKLLAKSVATLLALAAFEASAQEIKITDQKTADSLQTPEIETQPSQPESEITNVLALDPIDIKASRIKDSFSETSNLSKQDIAAKRSKTSDTTELLQGVPGASVYSAGGISGLPVMHGLADDRLHVQVDGMSLMQACPNHMNSVLSYIAPTSVDKIEVSAGISPVSLGGDNLGGTIDVKSKAPEFAKDGEKFLVKGDAGYFHRSNGNARGKNFGFTLAGEYVNLTYAETSSESDNYWAATGGWKKPGAWKANKVGVSLGAPVVAERDVGASEYGGALNRDLGLSFRFSEHLFRINLSRQQLDYEGFPNQRMDMIASIPNPTDTDFPPSYIVDRSKPSNVNTLVNFSYKGQYDWGSLDARVFHQDLRHHMDMIQERNYGMYMPMDTKATTVGGMLKASIDLSERDTLKLGSDFQSYRMGDWWPPIAGGGSMCCNDFWNIRDGKRDRVGLFAEWEARWNPKWLTIAGIRNDVVRMDAGPAQGYSNSSYKKDADIFNAQKHLRIDHNVDWTMLTRYTHDANQTYEAGFARKTRSPNVHERFPWSTFAMAALMNNFVGDGNGYVGNLDLKPEVAHTFSGTIDWHDADKEIWGVKATGYVTIVDNFIDAQRCITCGATNKKTKNAYVILQYINHSAQLYGVDLSGHRLLGRFDDFGSFTGNGVINYVMGKNTTTGDNLYHIMPLNGRFSLAHRLGGWTTTAEIQTVAAKTHVSQVRNEVPTPGYSLLNLSSSYEFKYARLDVGVDNVLNKFYLLPLGGAYVGQGNSMTTGGVPYGMVLPGRGRSINVAVNVRF